jgi:cyanophycin synthetase
VAVVTNIAADHLGEDGVETIEELARVKLVVPLSAEQVVLNADNSHCLSMRAALTGRRIVLFSTDPNNMAVREHVSRGGTAYVVIANGQEETITRLERDGSTVLIPSGHIPITFNGSARHNVENALAALAALHCLGISDDQSCESAKTFKPDPESNLGRLNPVTGFPFDVIVDYAHNKHGFEAIAMFSSRRSCPGRRLCVVTMNASRIDDNTARDAMTALAGHFDHYVTCNHDSPLKRREGFASVLQEGLCAAGVQEDAISACSGEDEAIDKALEIALPGDLVMILIGYEPNRVIGRLRDVAARRAH